MNKSTLVYLNPNNYYLLLTLPNPTHTQWIISFALDSILTQSIICTPLHTLPSPFPQWIIIFYSYPKFEVGVDLNMDDGKNNRPTTTWTDAVHCIGGRPEIRCTYVLGILFLFLPCGSTCGAGAPGSGIFLVVLY
jgi:hypothetical protein